MDRFLLALFLCVSWMPVAFSAGDPWNYILGGANGPGNWTGTCKTGTKQSPIAIKSADTTYEKLGNFTLKNYDSTPNFNFTVTNKGRGLAIAGFTANNYEVSGGGLGDVYTTAQFHLHWGSDNTKGSEHTLDGKEFAAELHFVSYNTKYSDLNEAISKPDGLAVLGVFIEVGGGDNPAFSFLEYANNVTASNSSITVAAFKLQPMLPPALDKFFRYSGSLTTPTCDESVTWTVFNDTVKISQAQMDHLRGLKDTAGQAMVNNYRPVQPLNNRDVKKSFMDPATSPSTSPPAATKTTVTASSCIVNINFGLFSLLLFTALLGR